MRPARTPYTPQRPDQGLLHLANEIHRAHAAAARRGPRRQVFVAGVDVAQRAQVEDGVPDKLARPVVRDVAAAVDLVQSHAARRQHGVGSQHVGAVGIAAQGQDGRVFQQQQNIPHAPLVAQFHQFRLQPERLVVSHAAEIEVLNHDSIVEGGRLAAVARGRCARF